MCELVLRFFDPPHLAGLLNRGREEHLALDNVNKPDVLFGLEVGLFAADDGGVE